MPAVDLGNCGVSWRHADCLCRCGLRRPRLVLSKEKESVGKDFELLYSTSRPTHQCQFFS